MSPWRFLQTRLTDNLHRDQLVGFLSCFQSSRQRGGTRRGSRESGARRTQGYTARRGEAGCQSAGWVADCRVCFFTYWSRQSVPRKKCTQLTRSSRPYTMKLSLQPTTQQHRGNSVHFHRAITWISRGILQKIQGQFHRSPSPLIKRTTRLGQETQYSASIHNEKLVQCIRWNVNCALELALEQKFYLHVHRFYMAMMTNADQWKCDVKYVFARVVRPVTEILRVLASPLCNTK